jgi:hypothetical protein
MTSHDACLAVVRRCHAFILLIGTRFGASVRTRASRSLGVSGPPDNLESTLKNSRPDYCANAHPPCSNPYFLRLWYSLPFTSMVGGHVLIVDLDEQQRVIEKGEMSSP